MAPRSKSKKARKSTAKTTRSSSTAVSTRKQPNPDEDGVPGTDFSEAPPEGYINAGDGSDETPHSIVAAPDWHSPRAAR